jgi:DNA primase large subunit
VGSKSHPPARGGLDRLLTISYHSVFEHLHKAEIRKAKDEGVMSAGQLETIVHPNEYFKRSYILKNLGKESSGEDVKLEG